jgi:hypothetical protein
MRRIVEKGRTDKLDRPCAVKEIEENEVREAVDILEPFFVLLKYLDPSHSTGLKSALGGRLLFREIGRMDDAHGCDLNHSSLLSAQSFAFNN